MNLLAKIFGGQTADSPRTPRERARRAREIRAIDAATSRWSREQFGIGPRKGH